MNKEQLIKFLNRLIARINNANSIQMRRTRTSSSEYFPEQLNPLNDYTSVEFDFDILFVESKKDNCGTSPWIPVGWKLPENSDAVFIRTTLAPFPYGIGHYSNEAKGYSWRLPFGSSITVVTHWMKIPE